MLPRKNQPEHEFLPAALEIQETPPSPLGRMITWIILLFFILAFAWAMIGEIDIITSAPGQIITSGHTKVIQPLEIGIVKTIHVKEGQSVNSGDILIELKPDQAKANNAQIQQQINTVKQDIIRLKALLNWSREVIVASINKILPSNISTIQQQLLLSQWQAYQASIASLRHQKNKLQSERKSIQQQINKYKSILPIISSRAAKFKTLTKKNYVSDDQYLQIEQQRLETQYDYAFSQQQYHELSASIQEVNSQSKQANKQFEHQTLTDLQEVLKQQKILVQEKIKSSSSLSTQILKSPISGVVQQLAIHTEGGVVTPAQQLMVIVPKQATLEVEATVSNKDIGFVKEGQVVEVKIDAFPFTKYGIIDATLANLSNDAIQKEDIGLIYKALVKLKKSSLLVEGKTVNLTPGMTVMVEIKTGKRRLIEYFLAPLLRYKQESIRER